MEQEKSVQTKMTPEHLDIKLEVLGEFLNPEEVMALAGDNLSQILTYIQTRFEHDGLGSWPEFYREHEDEVVADCQKISALQAAIGMVEDPARRTPSPETRIDLSEYEPPGEIEISIEVGEAVCGKGMLIVNNEGMIFQILDWQMIEEEISSSGKKSKPPRKVTNPLFTVQGADGQMQTTKNVRPLYLQEGLEITTDNPFAYLASVDKPLMIVTCDLLVSK